MFIMGGGKEKSSQGLSLIIEVSGTGEFQTGLGTE